MNTENSTDVQNYYLNGLNKIINEIVGKSADGAGGYIYRGEPKCYPKIASTVYRDRNILLELGYTSIESEQESEIEKVKTYLRSANKKDSAFASELQHYGSPTNFLDFTTDYNIALYFACAKLHGKDGRIVLLKLNQGVGAKYEIQWGQDPPNRAQAQKSVFVKPPEGFICPTDTDVKTVCIPKDLKQWILIHLHRFQDISYQTLFNDLHGYLRRNDLRTSAQERAGEDFNRQSSSNPVENLTKQEWHEKTVQSYIAKIEHSPYNVHCYYELGHYYGKEMRKYDCAIETFNKALLLNPDYSSAYITRGISYAWNNNLDRAIEDLVKVTQLNPKHPSAYHLLGEVYDIRGDCRCANEYYEKALELSRKNPAVAAFLSERRRSPLGKLEYM